MYCPPKLPLFFIKKCPPKLRNVLYIVIFIVPLIYPFLLKNNPLNFRIYYVYLYLLSSKLLFFIKKSPPKLHNLLDILKFIVPLNYPFSLKNVLLNFTICYVYLYLLSS